jgi:hypothetical protein
MSGGRKIDDHSFWAGSKSKDSVFPKGVHVKTQESGEGEGELMKYEDSSEQIKMQQDKGASKVKSHGRKDNYRN